MSLFQDKISDSRSRVQELELQDLRVKASFITTGQGVPNFTPNGRALYIRQDGGANTTLYVYEGSAWAAK